mmetsp:Transcript_42019/g.94932  ORF Transcript_42019/g.94932 Transcript_42019/m.94932 type:complete len:1008 (+) Transcript_42019:783-3806(+)
MRAWFLRDRVSDLPRLELPPPEKCPKFSLPVLKSQEGLQLACLYGDVYVVVLCPLGGALAAALLIHLTPKRPAALARVLWLGDGHTIDAGHPEGGFGLSVCDNLLLVHTWASGDMAGRTDAFDVRSAAASPRSLNSCFTSGGTPPPEASAAGDVLAGVFKGLGGGSLEANRKLAKQLVLTPPLQGGTGPAAIAPPWADLARHGSRAAALYSPPAKATPSPKPSAEHNADPAAAAAAMRGMALLGPCRALDVTDDQSEKLVWELRLDLGSLGHVGLALARRGAPPSLSPSDSPSVSPAVCTPASDLDPSLEELTRLLLRRGLPQPFWPASPSRSPFRPPCRPPCRDGTSREASAGMVWDAQASLLSLARSLVLDLRRAADPTQAKAHPMTAGDKPSSAAEPRAARRAARRAAAARAEGVPGAGARRALASLFGASHRASSSTLRSWHARQRPTKVALSAVAEASKEASEAPNPLAPWLLSRRHGLRRGGDELDESVEENGGYGQEGDATSLAPRDGGATGRIGSKGLSGASLSSLMSSESDTEITENFDSADEDGGGGGGGGEGPFSSDDEEGDECSKLPASPSQASPQELVRIVGGPLSALAPLFPLVPLGLTAAIAPSPDRPAPVQTVDQEAPKRPSPLGPGSHPGKTGREAAHAEPRSAKPSAPQGHHRGGVHDQRSLDEQSNLGLGWHARAMDRLARLPLDQRSGLGPDQRARRPRAEASLIEAAAARAGELASLEKGQGGGLGRPGFSAKTSLAAEAGAASKAAKALGRGSKGDDGGEGDDGEDHPRCPQTGELVVSQYDFYHSVFAPLSKEVPACVLIPVLTMYLESLKRFRLPCVEPQTPSLLVALCARTGRLKQLAALLQYKVVPSESAIVAAGLLKGVDLARTRMKCGLEDSGADSGADSEADLVEQLALDSLWRQGRGGACAGRLLKVGRFTDAAHLCLASLHAARAQAATGTQHKQTAKDPKPGSNPTATQSVGRAALVFTHGMPPFATAIFLLWSK